MQLPKINYYSLFLHVTIVALMVIVIYLKKQNDSMRDQIAPPQLKAGELFKEFKAYDFNNNEITFKFSDKKKNVLLFIFSTKCSYCQKSLPDWISIYEKYKDKYAIYGISGDGLTLTKEYCVKNKINFPVVFVNGTTFRKENKISGVPETILVKPDGLVQEVWQGYMEEIKEITQKL